MKHLLLIFLCVYSGTTLFAQHSLDDEKAIRSVIQQQETAWNQDDWETFSDHFTNDGTLINFVGQFWKGRNDIIAHFKLLGPCCLNPTSLKFKVTDLRFITPDIAIVNLEETLIADYDYDVPFHHYKKGETDYKMVTDIFIKTNNEWKISAAQLTLINQLISPHIPSEKH